ncbi:MAG TPA: amino acid ABC transporter permease, partial [Nocardioidaceae bacterium]|nr:amino acid ABC transporter permease [Nocardioidaceae bacterium]
QTTQLKAVPVRHPGRWIAGAILLVLVAMMVHALVFARVKRGNATETRFGWGTVGDYLFSGPILDGVVLTIELTLGAMAMGIIGGVLLAVMRLSRNPLLSTFSWLFIWFFRGTPLLVQLAFWGNLSYLFPASHNGISFGIPFGPTFASYDANTIVPPLLAAFLGLGLNEAAYMAEIVRAGILSVDEGQVEAASALGMGRSLMMRRVILPQAMRVIIPPTGNETISMLKNTSLVSIIAYLDLLYAAQLIYSRNYQTIPLLIAASLWYLILTSVLTVGQYYVERYYARGSSRELPPTPLQRIRGLLTGRPPGGAPGLAADEADMTTYRGPAGGHR